MDRYIEDWIIDIHSNSEVYFPQIYDEILHIRDKIELILFVVVFVSIINIGLLILILSELKRHNEKED